MKTAFKASIITNVGLGVLVFWLAQRPWISATDTSVTVTRPQVEGRALASQLVLEKSPPEPQRKFHWRQLESSDYRTYIANLRNIGCPEQTLRDIIVADVDNSYAIRREQLLRAPRGQLNQPALQARLQQIQSEEAGTLQSLLGPPATGQIAAETSISNSVVSEVPLRPSRLQNDKVSLPLVFQDPGPELKLNAKQLEVITGLRESFNQELSSLKLDPADPEYRRQWQKARNFADEMMSALLGSDFTLNYQMQVADQGPSQPKP